MGVTTFLSSILLMSQLLNAQTGQSPKTIYNHFVTSKNEVALTFDDGPDKKNTDKVLKVLREYNIKATFFMLGENVIKNKEVVKRVYDEGHSIGLHTFTHPNFHTLNYDQIHEEITKNQQVIYNVTGFTPKIIRPPYGIITNDFLEVAQDMGLTIYTWSNDSFDWKTCNKSNKIVKNVTSILAKGQIILMHDKSSNQTNSLNALPSIIKYAQTKGFSFRKLGVI